MLKKSDHFIEPVRFFLSLYKKYIFICKSMFLYYLKFGLILLVCAFMSACSRSSNPDDSVVIVATVDIHNKAFVGHGTGFVVAQNGYIVTNYHVIETALKSYRYRLFAFTEGKKTELYKLSIIWSSPAYDLAILRAPKLNSPPLVINTAPLEKEDSVTAIGFPGIANALDRHKEAWTISTRTKGVVSRSFRSDWSNTKQYVESIQHTATINTGNSGGPLMNVCGHVVGVNTFTTKTGQGTFFSSHASEIARALKQENIPATFVTRRCNERSSFVSWSLFLFLLFALPGGIAFAIWYIPPARKIAFEYSEVVFSFHKNASAFEPTLPHVSTTEPPEGFYLKNKRTSEIYPINGDYIKRNPVIIGRSVSRKDINISETDISRRHAKISCNVNNNSQHYIEDLNSRNGTKLNGNLVPPTGGPVKIEPGDRISMGGVELNFYGPKQQSVRETEVLQSKTLLLTGKDRATGKPINIEINSPMIAGRQNMVIIGRSKKYCDIILTDSTISSRGHAKIIYDGSNFSISDMNSTNGTKVNRRTLESGAAQATVLQKNMIIHLGSVELRVKSV